MHGATDREQHDLAAAARERDSDVADIEKKIALNQQILGMADQIRAAVAEVAAIDTDLTALDRQATAHRQRIDAYEASHREFRTRDRGPRHVGPPAAAGHARRGATRARPCGGAGTFAPCQFLVNAKAAEARIPELQQTVADRPHLEAQRDDVTRAVLATRSELAATHKRQQELKDRRLQAQKLTQYAEPRGRPGASGGTGGL